MLAKSNTSARKRGFFLFSALCGGIATGASVVAHNDNLERAVEEVMPIGLRTSPVDYGPGPGRGRPRRAANGAGHGSSARMTATGMADSTLLGSVSSIT